MLESDSGEKEQMTGSSVRPQAKPAFGSDKDLIIQV